MRAGAGCLLVAGALVAAAQHLARAARAAPVVSPEHAARFAPLLAHLPARAIVGYLTEGAVVRFDKAAGDPELERRAAQIARHYLIAQQTLAPLLLVLGHQLGEALAARHGPLRWVIGDYASAAAVPATAPEAVVHDAGNGTILWRAH